MRFIIAAALLLAVCASSVCARNFTVRNSCSYTVWPAIFTDPSLSDSVKPSYPTGWEAKPGSSVSFTVQENWLGGQIWARRECNFSNPSNATICKTGDCAGGLECTSSGAPPLTVAEFTLSKSNQRDFYDVSVINGFNVPLTITNNKGCPAESCPVDLNPICPEALKGPVDASGATIGCKSGCLIDPLPSNSPACCTGTHNTPITCPASRVPYYPFFKSNCPRSFAYAYDEGSSGSLLDNWCPGDYKADYTITFCP